MLKKDITYVDLDENTVTKVFWFNLRADELFELEMSFGRQGLSDALQALVDAEDTDTMMKELKRIILMTYGVREGDEFVKTEEVRQRFINTGAYGALLMELLTNQEALTQFVEGIMPKKIPGLNQEPKPIIDLPAPAPMDVARITPQQKAMGRDIVSGTGGTIGDPIISIERNPNG
jgi:hypothetical protein